jgi:hypothetical protein
LNYDPTAAVSDGSCAYDCDALAGGVPVTDRSCYIYDGVLQQWEASSPDANFVGLQAARTLVVQGLQPETVAVQEASVAPCWHLESAKLLAYYNFDDGTPNDISGNGRHGVWVGLDNYTDRVYRNRPIGQAALFDGSSRIVVDAFKSYAFGHAFSVSVWFQFPGKTGTGDSTGNKGLGDILSNCYGSPFDFSAETSSCSWAMRVASSTMGDGATSVKAKVRTPGYSLNGGYQPSDGYDFDADTQATAGNDESWYESWHHLVMTYDGAVMNLFIDGSRSPQYSFDFSIRDGWADGELVIVDHPLSIGGMDTPPLGNGVGGGEVNVVGQIDEVRIFGESLSAADVRAIYRCDTANQIRGASCSVLFHQYTSDAKIYALACWRIPLATTPI